MCRVGLGRHHGNLSLNPMGRGAKCDPRISVKCILYGFEYCRRSKGWLLLMLLLPLLVLLGQRQLKVVDTSCPSNPRQSAITSPPSLSSARLHLISSGW